MLWLALVLAFFVAATLAATRSGRPGLQWITKPAAAACFVAAGLTSGALDTRWGTILFAGLVFAALGDVLLIPKDKRAFLAGLVAFLLGHVAYAVAFGVRGIDPTVTTVTALVLAAVAVPVARWLWPHVSRSLRAPVVAYVVVITAMVALAAGTYAANGDLRIAAGAFAFYLSDLAVARERFVAPSFSNRLWGLPLYFGGQMLLATSPAGTPW